MYALEEADDIIRIYWGGLSFYAYNRNSAFEIRLGIALLANIGVAYQTLRVPTSSQKNMPRQQEDSLPSGLIAG